MIIRLTPEEIKEAEELAHARNDCKVHLNSKVWVKKGVSSYDNHLAGLKAELAVAKLLEVEINREIYGLKGDQQAPDLIYEGLGIEVKYRTKRGWSFALTKNDPSLFKSDVGVLVWPGSKENELDVVGFITRQDFLDKAKVVNYTYGPRLAVEADQLIPLTKENLLKEPKGTHSINPCKNTKEQIGKLLAPVIKEAYAQGKINWVELVQLEGSELRCRITVESLPAGS